MFAMDFKAAKEGFFDRQKVLDAVDKATVKNLSKSGANVRKTAQKSLVYSDKPSSAGRPPHAHRSRTIIRKSRSGKVQYSKKTGQALKRSVSFLREYLYFFYDQTAKSVVIGPVKLDSTIDSAALPALEYGGTSTIQDHGKAKRVSIAARPFMQPAFQAELPNLEKIWMNSVK